ncbi:two-component response regulator ORR9-like isoform X1 [Musa acuminata AAA Group]|uniref:two-component response regulator ORR9-like isoform X1 n=1 Tax=Musa acuminata AAA Group TaxID=214697 RepID=UPI0031DC8E40
MYLLWMTASLTGSSSRGSSRPHHPAKVTTTLLDRVERRGWDLKACVGASVTTVDSGSKALQMLGLREDEESTSPVPADKNKIEVNLVMTDYCMPGMTGYDLLKKIKGSSSLKNIPVVIMSSENVPSWTTRCLEGGAEEFFLKPIKLSDMTRLIPYLPKGKLQDQQRESSNDNNYSNKSKDFCLRRQGRDSPVIA